MNKNHLYPVILAGGAGTRFWPLSRTALPKQFIPLLGERSLFEATVERALSIASADQIYVMTNKAYRPLVVRQLKARGIQLPSAQILLEPSMKNTAPAIAWAAELIARRDSQGVIAVLPSDHYIGRPASWRRAMREASRRCKENLIVTFGVKPTTPHTGYGYLKTAFRTQNGRQQLYVTAFKEKPNVLTAKRYLRQAGYYWNSGMFVFRVQVMRAAISKHLPEVARVLAKGLTQRVIAQHWSRLPNISIDYGVLEKVNTLAAVELANAEWSDLGSWSSLWERSDKNELGNVFSGPVVAFQTQQSLVRASLKPVALVGVKNIVVVDTANGLLVADRNHVEQIRAVVQELSRRYPDSVNE